MNKDMSPNPKDGKRQPSAAGVGSAKMPSQYHENYQPMAQGLRIQLWQEGWQQRCERKKNGFNHFALEWIVPTDRR